MFIAIIILIEVFLENELTSPCKISSTIHELLAWRIFILYNTNMLVDMKKIATAAF